MLAARRERSKSPAVEFARPVARSSSSRRPTSPTKIMHRGAQKQPGLLAQYVRDAAELRLATTEPRVPLIFGQYLCWYQTCIGDYDGARKSFSIAPAGAGRRWPLAARGRLSRAPGGRRDPRACAKSQGHILQRGAQRADHAHAHRRAAGASARSRASTTSPPKRSTWATATCRSAAIRPRRAASTSTSRSTARWCAPRCGSATRSSPTTRKTRASAIRARRTRRREPLRAACSRTIRMRASSSTPASRTCRRPASISAGQAWRSLSDKISGIDPLTIEQTMLIQHSPGPIRITRTTCAVIAGASIRRSRCVRHAKRQAVDAQAGLYDVSVFFPPRRIVAGRPTGWASAACASAMRSAAARSASDQFPCLIEARYADEGDDAIRRRPRRAQRDRSENAERRRPPRHGPGTV